MAVFQGNINRDGHMVFQGLVIHLTDLSPSAYDERWEGNFSIPPDLPVEKWLDLYNNRREEHILSLQDGREGPILLSVIRGSSTVKFVGIGPLQITGASTIFQNSNSPHHKGIVRTA